MRSHLVRQGTITNVSQSSQSVEITDSNGVIHTQEIRPRIPDAVWLSTCGYLGGLGVNVVKTEHGGELTILQPDVLVDVSEAASAVGTSYTAHLVRRLRGASALTTTVEGSLINGIFDLIVQDGEISDDACVDRAISTRPLAMALLARMGRSAEVETQVRASIPALRQMRDAWRDERMNLEPFYMSPRWGLQGRADIVRRSDSGVHVVEMKAGSVPSGAEQVRMDHAAQVAGYAAMMGSIEPTHTIETSVWYVKATVNPLRSIAAHEAIGQLIGARNTIVLADIALQHGSIAPLRWLGNVAEGGSSYEYQAVQELRSALHTCDKTEILALRAWMSMAAGMHMATRVGGHGQRSLADVWLVPYDDKRTSPNVLVDLTVDHEASDLSSLHIVFHRPPSRGDTAIRIGDQVLVYPRPHDLASPCDAAMYKGVVRNVTAGTIQLAFRNKFIEPHVFDEPTWVIEQDVMDGSAKSLYAGLRAFINANPRTRAVLLGRTIPHHQAIKSIEADACTPQQRDVIERALAARELLLIQGPPGTGKTSTIIRRTIRELMRDSHERILAVAYTNRAANELCAVLDRNQIPYLRHGSVEGAEGAHAIPHLARSMPSDDLAQRISSARCIVATVQSMYSGSEIWDFGEFTTVIVDEASQILEPALLGITSRVPRVILVGDHCQLPPVLALNHESVQTTSSDLNALGLTSLDRSAFERLRERAELNNDPRTSAMLTQQGRMHADIMHVVSDAVYDGHLDTLLPWQRDVSPTPWHDILPHRTVFMSVESDDQAAAEAACIVRLATMLFEQAEKVGLELDLGVITPFRIQNARIRDLLPSSIRDIVTVDTVERFQGSERDIIIYGTAVSTSADLASIEAEIMVHGRSVDRKLNVAMTRARSQLVVVGNERVLATSAAYREVLSRLHHMSCPSA